MARSFTAASSHYLENASAVRTAVPMTMACWGNAASAHTGAMVGIYDNTNANRRYELRFGSGGNFTANHNDGTTNANAGSVATYSAGTWAHAAAVFTGTSDRTIYVNGTVDTNNTTAVAGSMAGCNVTTIGRRSVSTPSSYADGLLAEAAIWSVVLDAAELAALAKGFSPLLIRRTSLLAYWPLIGRYSPELEIAKGSFPMTVNSAVVADHCRVFYPRRKR